MWKQATVRATISQIYRSAGRLLRPAAGVLIVALALSPLHGGAQTLHNFTSGTDGQNPFGGLTAGRNGVLYGTTAYGGVSPACQTTAPPPGCGTVFQLAPPSTPSGAWTESVIYTFSTPDIYTTYPLPLASPAVGPDGKLYGTTAAGSALTDTQAGDIYELTPPSSPGGTWTGTVLYSFPAGYELPYFPQAGVVIGKNGVLYGTVEYAQYANDCEYYTGCGAVYSLTPPASHGGDWTYQTLYTFQGGTEGFTDGASPQTALVIGDKGELYGVTPAGGSGSLCTQNNVYAFYPPQSTGCGTVFELDPPASAMGAWTETVLYDFLGKTDGGFPNAVVYHDGALYGTVTFGGDPKNCGGVGCGGVFRLDQPTVPGESWHEKVIYSFTSVPDGLFPGGGVAFGPGGILYGATRDGGNSGACPQNPGCGTVFQLKPPQSPSGDWSEVVLHSFAATDGWQPTGAVVIGEDGNVYGTTYYGGTSTNCPGGCGVVFQVKTGAAEEIKDQGRQ